MATDPIVRLRRTGENLDPALREEILALGPSCIPRLIEMFEERVAGYPCAHAAELLVDLRATEAIVPLLRTASHEACDDHTCLVIGKRLPELGAAVLEPVLAYVAKNQGDHGVLYTAGDVLIDLNIEDPRIFEVLLLVTQADLSIGAGMLARYSDPRGMRVLEDTIANYNPDFNKDWSLITLNTVIQEYERNGGALTPEMRARVDGWAERFREEEEDEFAQGD